MDVFHLFVLFLVGFIPHLGTCLECFSCQQGYHSETNCAVKLPSGMSETCSGDDPECFTVVEWFQNGAIEYVRRGCWTTSNTSNSGGFCSNYDRNGTGVIITCKSCKDRDLCNDEVVYEPQYYRCTSLI